MAGKSQKVVPAKAFAEAIAVALDDEQSGLVTYAALIIAARKQQRVEAAKLSKVLKEHERKIKAHVRKSQARRKKK